ncbi:MAG: cation:proton antiporter, partial [Pseudomonadota bacterium]
LPLARIFNLPYSVLLAILGCALGAVVGFWDTLAVDFWDKPLSDFLGGLRELEISAEGYLWIFLPVLLFETAITLDDRALMDDLSAILGLAVVAVVVTTLVVGFTLHFGSGVSLVASLLLAAIIATTDPVAVVAIFREVGAPKRLLALVEGESLLNDAAAIALFGGFLSALQLGGDLSAASIIWTFGTDFMGGAAFGFLCGRLTGWMLSRLDVGGPAEITLSVALAYLVYGVAEHYLSVSGVVAVVIAGLAFGARVRAELSSGQRGALIAVWSQLAFWASSLIFVLASLLIPDTLRQATWGDFGLLIIITIAALAARALVLYGMLPGLTWLGMSEHVDRRYRFVMLWGGLRGALTLVLALSVSESRLVSEDIKQLVGTLATSFVLVTLLVQATTLRPLLRRLKLNELTKLEAYIRDSALELSHREIIDAVQEAAAKYGLDIGMAREVRDLYTKRLEGITRTVDIEETMLRDQLQSALATLASKELELYVDERARRMISRGTGARLINDASRLSDALRIRGLQGYRSEARRQHGYARWIRWTVFMHRRLRLDRPLAQMLAMRSEMLLVRRRGLRTLEDFVASDIAPIFGARVTESVSKFVEARQEDVDRHLDAIRLQYPVFWQELGGRYLSRIALRLESDAYRRLAQEGVVPSQVVRHLGQEILNKQRRFSRVPTLDLGLDVETLVTRLPVLGSLDAAALKDLTRVLRPRLVLPDQRIVRRGEIGDAMYFIASGAVEVRLENNRVSLGTGEFFGEMALVHGSPRTADVVSLGFCKLLVLKRDMFERFLHKHPDLHQMVGAIARERNLAAGAPA